MPATSARLASDRQLAFIRSLVAERAGSDLLVVRRAAEGLARGDLTSTTASAMIEALLASPRTTAAAPAASNGEQIAPPSAALRAGRMLLAGGIEATATLDSGRHVTVSIRTRKRSGRGWTNAALGEQDSRTNISILGSRVGWLNVDADGRVLLTLRTRRDDAVAAVRSVLDYAAGLVPAARVQEASRCGRCFRTLTDPVSIDRGIGPECFGRDTGSQHIAAVRVESGDAIVPERMPRTETVYRNREDALAADQAALDAAEAEMNRLVAERERAQENAAYEAEMREEQARQSGTPMGESLRAIAARAERTLPADVQRARDLIAEALDGYFGEPELSMALGVFDQLAAR